MRVTLPLLVRSIQGGFKRYAVRKGSVRRNSVISYADFNFYFKKVQFSFKKNTTHLAYKVKYLLKNCALTSLALFGLIYKLKHGFYDWGRSTSRKFNKKTNKN